MRISDWSSDVCSSDLGVPDPRLPELGRRWLDAVGAAADDWAEHRLRLGVTEGVAELGSGETLWLECNAAELGGVSFTKEIGRATSELQSLMRISYAVFCLKKKKTKHKRNITHRERTTMSEEEEAVANRSTRKRPSNDTT